MKASLTHFAQTKKKRSTRRQLDSSDLIDAETPTTNGGIGAQQMDVDVKPAIPNMDLNFVDDDELQAALARARRRKLNKAKIPKAEEIAEQRKSSMTCLNLFRIKLTFFLNLSGSKKKGGTGSSRGDTRSRSLGAKTRCARI